MPIVPLRQSIAANTSLLCNAGVSKFAHAQRLAPLEWLAEIFAEQHFAVYLFVSKERNEPEIQNDAISIMFATNAT